MKITVWTKYNPDPRKSHNEACSKCVAIFDDYKGGLPSIGMKISVKNGFSYERVENILVDMVNGDVEIYIATCDPGNEYGPSLL